MYSAGIVVEGIADFLFNRMSEEELRGFRAGQGGGDKTDEARAKAAELKVYADDEGLYLPAWTVKKAIIEGAHSAGLKLNRKPLRQRLAAVMFVQGVGRFTDKKGKPITERDYMSEVVGRIPPGPKGRATIVRRPALRGGWRLRAGIAVLDDGVPDEAIKTALESAGLYVGIGAWRPEFGRFVVREFKVTK